MSPTTFTHCARVVLIAALLSPIGSHATALTLPDFPLFLTSVGVPPNLIMTIDNSGSMARSWMPDDVDTFMNTTDLPRFASASVNGIYYNPRITYVIPTRSDGVSYTTSFDNAWFNGFDTSMGPSGGLNLGASYKVAKQSSPDTPYSSASFVGSAQAAYYYMFYSDISSSTPKPDLRCDGARTNNYCYVRIVVGGSSDIAAGDSAAQKQNFAIWYSFYRTRVMAVMSGAMISISGVNNDAIRFGWQTINGGCTIDPGTSCPGYGTTTTTTTNTASCSVEFKTIVTGKKKKKKTFYYININATTAPCNAFFSDIPDGTQVTISGIKNPNDSYNGNYTVSSGINDTSILVDNIFTDKGPLSNVNLSWTETKTVPVSNENRLKVLNASKKTTFSNWLQRINVAGWTPMRSALKRVGTYYQQTGQNSAYAENPYVSLGEVRACRKNFHVLFTDGLWNQDKGYTAPGGNQDPDSTGSTTLGNSDDVPPSSDPTSYSPRLPYKDVNVTPGGGTYSNSNSLADTALYYWAKDLNTSLADKLSPSMVDFSGTSTVQFWNPKNDPATWQHMVNYPIGLGLSQTLVKLCDYSGTKDDPNNPTPGCPVWTGSTYTGGYDGLSKGTLNWPKINESSSGDDPDGHVYDLWHMAINSRGKFYSADNPDDLIKAFQDVINTISSAAASGGGAKVSSNVARITEANPTAFVARFNADWSGTLQAFPFNVDGSLGATPYWEAGRLIPSGNLPASAPPSFTRKIFTRNSGNAQEFTIANGCASGDLKTALDKKADGTVDNLCSQRLAWLRGYIAITGASWNSTTKVVTFTAPNHGMKAGDSVVVTGVTPVEYNKTYTIASVTTDTFTTIETVDPDPGSYVADETDTNKDNDDTVRYANFRDRTASVLGDIMNSGTVYAHKNDFGYGNLSSTTNPLIGGGSSYKTYVEGKASRTPVVYVGANDGMLHAFNAEISGANMGKELFAYVPAGVYDKLSALTDLTYTKTHKYLVDGTPTLGDAYIGSGWKTYLVGGLRAGGKSIYALDVSNPNSFAATDAKWEFTDTDLGLTFGQPQIAAVSTAQWAAIFGNGYNSTAEHAYLYIVDLSNGTQIAKIATNSDISNGLSTPYPFDKDGDGIVDVIYAGDLQGNLWKFEKNGLGVWGLGNGGNKLFQARISSTDPVQAITGQPTAMLTSGGDVMVYFGTGRYLEASDLTNGDTQSFYAILDKSEDKTISRADLLEQRIISSTVTVAGSTYTLRTVTNNTATAANRGYYLNFPTTTGQPSERVTSTPLIKSFTTAGLEKNRVIFVTSTPTSDPCEKSGSSWLMELSASLGRLGGTSPFDLNKDQAFNSSDKVTIDGASDQTVSGLKLNTDLGIVNEITWVEGDTLQGIAYKLLPGTSGKVESIANSSDKTTPGGPPKRISWEQIQ